MKYKAVIFDLGGTLVPDVPWSVFHGQAKQMAAALSVPEDEYVERWFAESHRLGTGDFESYQHYNQLYLRGNGRQCVRRQD